MKHIVIFSLVFLMLVSLLPFGISAAPVTGHTPARMMAQEDAATEPADDTASEPTDDTASAPSTSGSDMEKKSVKEMFAEFMDHFLRFFAWWTVQINKLFSLM